MNKMCQITSAGSLVIVQQISIITRTVVAAVCVNTGGFARVIPITFVDICI